VTIKPNYLKYDASVTDNRLAVFSQIYYPYGWQAFMDGVKVDHIRADYALRALVIPAGKHTVEFRFEPATLKKGKMISMVGSFLVLLLILGTVFVEWKGRKKPAESVR
jgi:uncharacterized membrane protein YfhO